MSTRRRTLRGFLVLLALVAGIGCCALLVTLTMGQVGTDTSELLEALAWGCGLGTCLLTVAALQEHTDPDDDPRYLETIVHGFVDEWRR